MSKQCPKCGYAMDAFDETCKRCANLKEPGKAARPGALPTAGRTAPESTGGSSSNGRSGRTTGQNKPNGLLIGAWVMAPILGAVLGVMCFGAALIWRKGEEGWLGGLPAFIVVIAIFELVVRKVREGGLRTVGPRWLFYGCALLLLVALLPNLPSPKRHATSRPQPDVSAILEPGTHDGRFTVPKKNDPSAPVEPTDSAPSSYTPPVQRTTATRQMSRDYAKTIQAQQRQMAEQNRPNNNVNLQPLRPARTQPPNWVPRGQTSGRWEYTGCIAGSGEDCWNWIDGNGRTVGPTVLVRSAQ